MCHWNSDLLAVFIDVNRQPCPKKCHSCGSDPDGTRRSLPVQAVGRTVLQNSKTYRTSLCRIYLVDRETGDLVPRICRCWRKAHSHVSPAGKSKIVLSHGDRQHSPDPGPGSSGYQSVVRSSRMSKVRWHSRSGIRTVHRDGRVAKSPAWRRSRTHR